MKRPLLITTPVLTFDEVVKDLGIGKARLSSILKILRAGLPPKREIISAAPFVLKRKTGKSRGAILKSGARKKVR